MIRIMLVTNEKLSFLLFYCWYTEIFIYSFKFHGRVSRAISYICVSITCCHAHVRLIRTISVTCACQLHPVNRPLSVTRCQSHALSLVYVSVARCPSHSLYASSHGGITAMKPIKLLRCPVSPLGLSFQTLILFRSTSLYLLKEF